MWGKVGKEGVGEGRKGGCGGRVGKEGVGEGRE